MINIVVFADHHGAFVTASSYNHLLTHSTEGITLPPTRLIILCDLLKASKYRNEPLTDYDKDFVGTFKRKFNNWEVYGVEGFDHKNPLLSTIDALRSLDVEGQVLVVQGGAVFNFLPHMQMKSMEGTRLAISTPYVYLHNKRLNMYTMIGAATSDRLFDTSCYYFEIGKIEDDCKTDAEVLKYRSSSLPRSLFMRSDQLIGTALGGRDSLMHGAAMREACVFNCWGDAIRQFQDTEKYVAYPYDLLADAMKGVKRYIPESTRVRILEHSVKAKQWASMGEWAAKYEDPSNNLGS
jgi:hypothetical protein